MYTDYPIAPAWCIAHWLNTPSSLTLQALRGRVVVIHAFQMLCPACVSQGLPQAARIDKLFSRDAVRVVGLHTVFEHHAVMSVEALKAFVHEYRLEFPIGVDQPDPTRSVPLTMQAFSLQGTPSLVLVDKAGRVRLTHFGPMDDLAVGAAIGQLSEEEGPPPQPEPVPGPQGSSTTAAGACSGEVCPVDELRRDGGE